MSLIVVFVCDGYAAGCYEVPGQCFGAPSHIAQVHCVIKGEDKVKNFVFDSCYIFRGYLFQLFLALSDFTHVSTMINWLDVRYINCELGEMSDK